MSKDKMVAKAARILSISVRKANDKAEEIPELKAIYVKVFDGSVIVSENNEHLVADGRIDKEVLLQSFKDGERGEYVKTKTADSKKLITYVLGFLILFVLTAFGVFYSFADDSETIGEDNVNNGGYENITEEENTSPIDNEYGNSEASSPPPNAGSPDDPVPTQNPTPEPSQSTDDTEPEPTENPTPSETEPTVEPSSPSSEITEDTLPAEPLPLPDETE